MLKQQRVNLFRAYLKNNLEHGALADILDEAETKFNGLFTCHEFTKPLKEDELKELPYLQNLPANFPEYSFNFTSQHVTERLTGKCTPLKKFCEINKLETKEKILAECKTSTTLIISSSPEFLAGMSVTKNGQQLDNSCHYPGSDNLDYKSGAISCAIDQCTIGFFKWADTGITGRQLVYLNDTLDGFITGRCYGDFTESDSTYLRCEVYKILQTEKFRKATSCINIVRNGYKGYLDESYFTAFRKEGNNQPIRIVLAKPLCPDCGHSHSNGGLFCDDCDTDTIKCTDCNCSLHEDDTYYTDYDGPYCQSCFDDKYSYCSCCGETFDKDEVYNCGGDDLCSHCAEKKGYYKCSDCGDYTDIDDMQTYNGDSVCSFCLPSNAIQCDDCSEFFDPEDIETDVDGKDWEKNYCTSCSNLTACKECSAHTSNGELCCGCETMLEDTPYTCPVCGERLETPSCCSDKCTSKNLFTHVPFFTPAPYYINARKGTSGQVFIRVRSFKQFYREGYYFHVTNQIDNTNAFTITEHETGMTASQWFTGTIDATITAFNNTDIEKTITALQHHNHLRGAN